MSICSMTPVLQSLHWIYYAHPQEHKTKNSVELVAVATETRMIHFSYVILHLLVNRGFVVCSLTECFRFEAATNQVVFSERTNTTDRQNDVFKMKLFTDLTHKINQSQCI